MGGCVGTEDERNNRERSERDGEMDNCWTEIQVDKDTMVFLFMEVLISLKGVCLCVCVTVTSRQRLRYSCLASLDALSSMCGRLLIGLLKLRCTSCQYTYS